MRDFLEQPQRQFEVVLKICASPSAVIPSRKARDPLVGRRPERSEACLAIARHDAVESFFEQHSLYP
jgi:hypothetical protein